MLTIINGKQVGFVGIDRIYIGRANRYYGLGASVLANPFFIGADGTRAEVIEKYRCWLWHHVKAGLAGQKNQVFAEVMRIAKLVSQGKKVELSCYCAPLSCHGDVIARCVQWIVDLEIGERSPQG
jgi:hypothetical protein